MGKKESLNNPKIVMDLPTDAKLVTPSPNKKIISQLPEDAKPIDTTDGNPYLRQLQNEQNVDQFNDIIKNIPDLNDSGKETIGDLAKNGIKGKELSDAILTLQNKHPHQDGGNKLYYDDKGIPRPLKNDERPPVGYEVGSIWGSRKDAQDDGLLTTFAKNVYNVLPSIAENAIDLVHLPYGASTGKEADWYKSLKNAANYLKTETSDASKESVIDTNGIDEFKDVFDSKRWHLTPDNIVGTVGQLVKSIGEFYFGGEIAKPVLLAGKVYKAGRIGAEALPELGKWGTRGALGIGSYMTQLGDAIDAAKEAGLDTKDAYQFGALITVPIAAVDLAGGFEGKILKDQVARTQRKDLLKNIAKGMAEDGEGKLTQEALQDAFKATMIGNAALTKTWAKETVQDMGSEAAQEVAQEFIQKLGEQLYDNLSDSDKKKFGTYAFGPKAFAEYLQQGIAGALGGAPTSVAYNRIKNTIQEDQKSKTAFGIAQQGEQAVNSFKKNAEMELKQGKLSQEEYDNAIFKVDRYHEYNKAISTKNINDDTKRRIFDLTFQKGQLVKQLEAEKLQSNPDGINDASIQTKETQVKDIEKEIKTLVLPSQIIDQPVAADKTVEDAIKHHDKLSGLDVFEKEAEKAAKENKKGSSGKDSIKDLLSKYGKEINEAQSKPKESPELRKFEEIPNTDWNQKRDAEKFRILSEHLDTNNQSQVGEMQLMKGSEGRITNDTVHIKLPNNKFVIFASSATDLKTKLRGHLHTENLAKDFDGQKVVIKPTRLTTGRVVLPVWNAETGKYIGYVREDNTGKANEKLFTKRAEKIGVDNANEIEQIETEELQHLKTVKLTKNEIEALSKPNSETKPETQDIKDKITPETKPVGKETVITNTNEQESTNRGTVTQTESVAANDEKSNEQNKEPVQLKTKRIGKKRERQKILDPRRIKALNVESTSPYDLALQYFIKNGHVARKTISALYKDSQKEINKRFSLWKLDAPTAEQIAEQINQENEFLTQHDESEYRNAVEEVLSNFHSRTEMADDINNRWNNKMNPNEQIISEALDEAEKNGTLEITEDIIGEIEKLGNDKIEEIANDQKIFDVFGNEINPDIYTREENDEEDPFQKQKASTPNLELEKHEAVLKVAKRIQKVLPGIKVIYDKKLKAAGKWSPTNKVLSINPYFAGIDTPIHEAGHILIDVLGGMNNKVVAKAINQLKDTELYSETKERYPKLNDEHLGYEVLAEAIGREGEGIFGNEIEKNKFIQYLEYFFNRLKQLLGLDKNIAKSLAQQVLWGIGLQADQFNIQGDQLQKPFTAFEDKTREQQVKALTLSFEQYSKEILNRDVISEADNLKRINDALENPDLTEEDTEQLNLVKDAISERKKQDLFSWLKYKEDIKLASIINYDIEDLEKSVEKGDLTEQEYLDGMIGLYNVVSGMQEAAKKTVESNVMTKLSYALFNNQKKELKKNDKFIEEIANNADISVKDVWLKNLGHVTEKVPELQGFSKMYDEATFDKVTEAKDKKNTFEKLGTAVIKAKNKQLGITDTAKSLFSSDSAKYFDWIDNGNGEMITAEDAEKKGLSDAHIEFLKYYRELVSEHQGLIGDVYNAPLEVLKTDPTFKETFKQDGITKAFSNFLGTNYNLKQVRIAFTDPETHQKDIASFGDIENKIVNYGKKGIIEKAKALALIIKYNRQARIQLKKGINVDQSENPLLIKNNSQYSINGKGILSSKFDKPRDKNRGYSKDFYRAGIEFIDDMTHVKHMSKLIPVINSIEYLNEHGYAEHLAKPNVVKYIKEWKDLHVFKNPKETLPEIDATLRFVRFLTSATTMMFNVPAGIMNLSMGLYNNWRAETDAWRAKGHGRLFLKGGRKANKDYAFGLINPKAIDILRKYNIVSVDYDSNPKLFAGRVFDNLAHALTRYGEFQIQGTNFLGQLTEDEWNSFEYKENKHGIDELVLKDGVDEKTIKNKFITYKNKISDIQGKYGEADMRNFTNNELGKSIAQFKNWIPDWWRMRFGERYIDRNGEVKQGSWRVFVGEGLDELRSDIREKGYVKAFWENKDFMSNLKGAMVTVMFMALAYDDDDDKKRKNGAIDADNALSQLLFVFDPNQLKFTVSRPIAAIGTIEKFIDATQHLIDLDADKFEKDLIKLTPANKILKIGEMLK